MRDSRFLLHRLEELGKGSKGFSRRWLQGMRKVLGAWLGFEAKGVPYVSRLHLLLGTSEK